MYMLIRENPGIFYYQNVCIMQHRHALPHIIIIILLQFKVLHIYAGHAHYRAVAPYGILYKSRQTEMANTEHPLAIAMSNDKISN